MPSCLLLNIYAVSMMLELKVLSQLFGAIIYLAKDFWKKSCSVPSDRHDPYAVANLCLKFPLFWNLVNAIYNNVA